jgi:phosphoribosyl 1,2-cyclic phosphodiesterase
MVRFTVLASGSKGNSTVVTGGRTHVLVDCGLSCRELFRRMRLAGEEPETLDAILITHEHSDHVRGVAVTARKLGIPVYFTEATHQAWARWIAPRKQMSYAQWLEQTRKEAVERHAEAVTGEGKQDESNREETADTPQEVAEPVKAKDRAWLPAVEYFQAGESFAIGDISVSPFSTPHDAADPCGFVFKAEGVRLAFATDLGYIPPNVKAQLQGLDLLLLESNHDLEMLRDGPYPWAVKQRVLSRVGHLSNEAAAGFLEDGFDGHAAYVILAHLSENNNLPELARVTAERALGSRASFSANKLLLASQHDPLSSIDF